MPKKKSTTTKKTASKSKTVAKEAAGSKKSIGSLPRSASDKKVSPIAFSLDDVAAIVESKKKSAPVEEATVKKDAPKAAAPKKKVVVVDQPVEKRVHAPASLADILGFNPAQKKDTTLQEDDIPKKWKKYYKLLIELRDHVRDEIDLHTADTLKHHSDDSGERSSYGNHQADAGTDEFDRDFALSLVSSEQDALHEIEEAIQRIKDGSYGVCEVTGEPINKERLEAVPFARFSVEGQAEYEKNKRRKVERNVGGLFADNSDAPKITSDDDED